MKPRNFLLVSTLSASALLCTSAAFAADGSWTSLTGGSWNDAANWAGGPPGVIAEGAGFTANFNTLDPSADVSITLDADLTLGSMIFGDTATASPASWILAAGPAPGILTLDAETPTITVNPLGTGKNVTITATLAGTKGFTKAGAGTLVLNNTTNTISGPVVVAGTNGFLNIQSRPLTSASSVAINAGTLVSATAGFKPMGDAVISFGGGNLQYNTDPTTDYSAQFSTAEGQLYRINVQGGRTVTYASDLASPGGTLTKLATGTLVLAGANTFTGNTVVSAGTLELSHPLALQNSPLNTAATAAATATSGIVLTGVTSPTFGGLTGNKTLASVFDTDSGNYGQMTNVTLNPGTGADFTHSGGITEGAAGMTLTKTGAGRQVLAAANSHTGGTILNAGTLNYGNAAALSTGPVSFTGDSILQAGVATTLSNPIDVAEGVVGTVGTNGFTTTLSGPITGAGTFTKGGGGTLTLTGAEANTLSGGIRVVTGRLNVLDGLSLTNTTGPITVASGASLNYSKNFEFGNDLPHAISIAGPGNSGFGALNLQGNVTASGPITLTADATISHNFNFATITGPITAQGHQLTLTTTQSAQPGILISGSIDLGTGGILVNAAGGSNTVTLSGSISYTGETRVATGKLILSGDARIQDSATVRVDAGAVLELAFEGTDRVGALYLGEDPEPKPEGTYGSPDSSATFQSEHFAGSGILEVGGAANDFNSWAASQNPPVTGGPEGDHDGDGVPNLVEFALADGGERGVLSGTTITFTKRGTPYGGDLTYVIETSETLTSDWTPAVTHGPAQLGSPISYDLAPMPGTPRKFARLKVLQNP